jgi:hypothetical protein
VQNPKSAQMLRKVYWKTLGTKSKRAKVLESILNAYTDIPIPNWSRSTQRELLCNHMGLDCVLDGFGDKV